MTTHVVCIIIGILLVAGVVVVAYHTNLYNPNKYNGKLGSGGM